MTRLALASALMSVATCAAAADIAPVDPDRVDAFIDIVAANECRLSNGSAGDILPGAGFNDRDEVRGIVARLLYYGRARNNDGALQVFDGPCPAYEGEPLKEQFLKVLGGNNCQMTALESVSLLNAHGMKDYEVTPMIPFLQNEELVTLSEDDKVISLTEEACTFYSAGLDQTSQESVFRDPGGYLIELASETGCSIELDAAVAAMEPLGLDRTDTKGVANLYIEAGQASASGSTLTFGAEVCQAAGAGTAGPDPIAEPRAALVAYLEQNGCSLAYDGAAERLTAAGFDFDKLDKLVPDYIAEGIMSVGANETLILNTGSCS
ncbi:hypothetical protein [uncultured Shimia sp.]|uniref:hypothetical protein n=1 Tax=uncultured Shimia sp. TaxID=573152 RepID=UPI00262AE4B6|nr:hypothetical protein [uncultured Shimia sp.]